MYMYNIGHHGSLHGDIMECESWNMIGCKKIYCKQQSQISIMRDDFG